MVCMSSVIITFLLGIITYLYNDAEILSYLDRWFDPRFGESEDFSSPVNTTCS